VLRVDDFNHTVMVSDEEALERALRVRYADANSFWLTHDHEKNPAVSILVRGELAYVHYFPSESHPGFASVGSCENVARAGSTIFFMDSVNQEQEILNASVVPFSKALKAATEFFSHKELPSCLEWTEL
jgi:hypothetical protein